MHPTAKNLTGIKFGRLTALRPIEKRKARCMVWLCRCECGNTTVVQGDNLRSGHTKSCGCFQRETVRGRGVHNANWKGGRQRDANGYIVAYAPNHPRACKRYVLEHRLVMEQKLGRYLRPEEVVHHIDGDPANNVRENLDLFANVGKHKGYHHKLELIGQET